jgi:energy-coupling factor transporter ATP-binding protein EcfA2/thiamine kinase-like enzyme
VLQDTVLFSGTVAENIAYGIDARQEEVEAAAKAAGAHGFISQLPEGYETALGARGVGLSGGQRQRIAIARTLLRDPAILILDEPTTGLDSESEAQVLDGLSSLMRGRTTVIISHSPTLLRSADRALSIEDGRIVGDLSPERHADLGVVARTLLRPVVDKLRRPAERPQMLPTGPPRRAAVPDDPALPQLPVLLDPDAMAPFLHRSLGPDVGVPDVRIQYLRYKPRTNIVVRYDVGIDGVWHDAIAMLTARPYLARRAAKPENQALARLVDGRSPASTPMHYEPELGALIQWYPLDLALPALAAPPLQLQQELAKAGLDCPGVVGSAVLAYKPRRRAVLRADGHVLKFYAKEEEFDAALLGLRVSGALRSLRTPTFEAELANRRLTVQSLLEGTRPARPEDVADGAGDLLCTLHASKGFLLLPVATPTDQLAGAGTSASLVCAIAPELAPRVQALLRELEDSVPEADALVPSHGDFNARQLLIRRDGLAAVDFDGMCRAPAALDVATYASYVVLGGRDDLNSALDMVDEVVEGYGDRPLGLSWYLATCILRRAPRPFRYLDEHWPERVEGMVSASEAALRS